MHIHIMGSTVITLRLVKIICLIMLRHLATRLCVSCYIRMCVCVYKTCTHAHLCIHIRRCSYCIGFEYQHQCRHTSGIRGSYIVNMKRFAGLNFSGLHQIKKSEKILLWCLTLEVASYF